MNAIIEFLLKDKNISEALKKTLREQEKKNETK